jgi:hypothetical protein
VDVKLQVAIVERVRSWATCSASYLNAYCK